MGWTHSWTRPIELPAAGFEHAVDDIIRILPALKVDLAGFDGHGDPILVRDHLVFNGRMPQHCEPFEIRRIEFDRRGRSEVFSFCKTEKMPYDICVQIALIVLRHHCGSDFIVRSDGGTMDWAQAIDCCQSELGYGDDFLLMVDSE